MEASPCRVPSARLGDAPVSVRRRPDHPPRASRGRLAKPEIDIAADPYTNACFFASPYKRRIYRCSSSASCSGCVAGHRAVARKTGRNSPIADNRRSSAKRRDRSRFLGGDRQTDTHGVGLYQKPVTFQGSTSAHIADRRRQSFNGRFQDLGKPYERSPGIIAAA